MLYTLHVSPCNVCVISETQQQIPGILARPAASTPNEIKLDTSKQTENFKCLLILVKLDGAALLMI